MKKSAESNLIYAMGDATVKLKITKVTDKVIVGEVIDATVVDLEARKSVPLKCEFAAEIK